MTLRATLPRGFRQARCEACALPASSCICQRWRPLEAPLSISIVMPRSEARSASNSARLLALWLPSTELCVRGGRDGIESPEALLDRQHSAVLFPGGDEHAALPSGVKHLIVPDGTWSQARRIERRWFAPHALPRVHLSRIWPSVYRLRRGRVGLCTFEATAIALGLLADAALAQTLLHRFAEWARRAEWLKTGGPSPVPAALSGADAVCHPAARMLANLSAGVHSATHPSAASGDDAHEVAGTDTLEPFCGAKAEV